MTSVRRTPLHAVTVSAVLALTPRMRRITLAGPSLVGVVVAPAQDIEVVLPDATGRRVKRRYTVRRARPELGEIDVDALVHDHGPGGRWAGSTAPGATLQFFGPRGHLELRPSDWHLFVGDEAGLPAIAALTEAADEPTVAIVEVGDQSDELEVAGGVTWLHRGGRAAGGSELLAAALGALTPRGNGRAYLLGESRAMVALRPAVEALGIDAEHTYVKGYWNLGRGSRHVPG